MSDDSMTVKQLISTVRNGRMIRIQPFDDYSFNAYLCGMDEGAYFVVIPPAQAGNPDQTNTSVVKRIINKSAIQYIDLYDERTFREEPAYEDMVGLVQPFKDSITSRVRKGMDN